MPNDHMTKEVQMTNDEKSKGLLRSISSFVVRLPRCSYTKAGHSFDSPHSSFVILAATRLLLVSLLALCVSCSSKRITKANVDQVAEGMSKKQVESILGPPTSRTTEVYVYRQGKDTVAIVFKGDKVQSKKSTLSD
jgi:hypothetical protein